MTHRRIVSAYAIILFCPGLVCMMPWCGALSILLQKERKEGRKEGRKKERKATQSKSGRVH
eukprot:1141674-Pelagomonas_calceolata.AAC.4